VNVNGITSNVNLPVTTLLDNGNDTFTFTNELGVFTTINYSSTPAVLSNTLAAFSWDTFTQTGNIPLVSTLINNGNGTATYTPGDGTTPVVFALGGVSSNFGNDITLGTDNLLFFNETVTTSNQSLTTGNITYTNENGVSNVAKIKSANAGNVLTIGTDGGLYFQGAGVLSSAVWDDAINTIILTFVDGSIINIPIVDNIANWLYKFSVTDGTVSSDVLNTDTLSITQGNGVTVELLPGNIFEISSKISIDLNNDLSFGSDNGLFVDSRKTTVVDNLDGTATIIDDFGNSVDCRTTETLTTLALNGTNLDYTDELGAVTTVALPPSGWALTGDTGTDGGVTNWIGTNDAQDFVIHANGAEIGRFGQVNNITFGSSNTAIGVNSVVSGGSNNVANVDYSTVSGGAFNVADGEGSTIGGGGGNTAVGVSSVVGGGKTNNASGENSVVSGGDNNMSRGDKSSISGGTSNTTYGNQSVISGGTENITRGENSTVSGGASNTAYSYGEWVGGLYSINYTPISTTAWDATDRLFVIGNGQGTGLESNAITVLKNGNTGLSTSVPITKLDVADGNINIPTTSSATVGNITQFGDRLIHTYGTNSTFVGRISGNYSLTGIENTGIGNASLFALTSGQRNTGVGYLSFRALTSGTGNVAIGTRSMQVPTTASGNVAIGEYSLRDLISGNNNIGIGQNAGAQTGTGTPFVSTGSQNIFIGSNTTFTTTAAQYNNSVAIGHRATIGASDAIILGAISGINGATANSNVGIGTTTPSFTFDVNGTARIVTTPTITTATKVLVKNPTTGQISEQSFPISSKKLTGTTGATQGATISIPHGLDASKILGYSAIVEYSMGNTISENYTRINGYQFHISSTATDIVIVNHTTNSANILSKPIRVIVNYEL
jgi:hypothetical protein